MQALGNYLLRIVAAALLLGAAGQLVRGKRGKQMLRLCGGLCMALVVLAPLPGLASLAGSNSLSDALLESQPAAENLAQVREELGKLISQQTEAYILDKARSLGASVTVEVSLEALGDYYLRPSAVTIRGAVTPAQQQALAQWLQEDLALTGGQVTWEE